MNKYYTDFGIVITNVKAPDQVHSVEKPINRETAQNSIQSATQPPNDDPHDPWVLIDACNTWMRASKIDAARREVAEAEKRRKYEKEIAAATELM